MRPKPVWLRVLLLAAMLLSMAGVAGAAASHSLGCATHRCGLLADGAYAHLVIGTLTHVGSAEDMQRVYHWAKAHGYWRSLPSSPAPYLRDVKLITISLPGSQGARRVTVFMQQAEYASAPYVAGDLVRYSPHDLAHESPRGNADDLALYHGLTGCVATLCRQSDPACFKRYRQGVFTKSQGTQVDPKTGKLVPGGVQIDPHSLLPVR